MENELELISGFVKNFMSHSGHPYSHVKRVFLLCRKVAEKDERLNKYVLFPAALLHDIARANQMGTKVNNEYVKKIIRYDEADFEQHHSGIGAKWAANYLQTLKYPQNLIDEISYCIKTHSYEIGECPRTIEARLLQESDRIDAMGAVGVIRTTVHNACIKAYHPTDPLAVNRFVDDRTYGVDHFLFKLLKLKDTISVESLKPFAEERHTFMLSFLKKLEEEVLYDKCKGPANTILNIMRSNSEMKHYDDENPFQPCNNTIVGRIVQLSRNGFIKKFVEQLKTEIL